MKKPMTRAEKTAQKFREIAKLYKRHGTAAGVAEALGVSRQRAALLLSQADEAGALVYKRREPITTTKTEARAALREAGGIVAAAAALGMSEAAFARHFPDLVADHKDRAAASRSTPADVREERATYAESRRQHARKHGICTICFRNEAGEGRVTCVACSTAAVDRRKRLQGKK